MDLEVQEFNVETKGTGRKDYSTGTEATQRIMDPSTIHDAVKLDSTTVNKSSGKLVKNYFEKMLLVSATKTGLPGPLKAWVEIADSDEEANYKMVGDKEEFDDTETKMLAWTTPSKYARFAIRVPAGADSTNYWTVTTKFSGQV